MIIDNLKNASLYYSMHKGFEKAFAYLIKADIETREKNAFEINGKNIKAIISTSELKSKNNAILKAHQKHIDIQIPLSQTETYGWKSTATINKIKDNYDALKDLELHDDAHLLISLYHQVNLQSFSPKMPKHL